MAQFHDVFETALGWVGLLSSDEGVRRTTLPQPSPADCVVIIGAEAAGSIESPDRLAPLRDRIEAYFLGERVDFADEPVDVDDAPPFLKAAWAACLTIPYGETRTYKWLAEEAGKPRAQRAAGQSMARNRLPIVVPCHRVIASDGSLRGFGKGASQLDLKRLLLELEGGG